MVDIKQLYWTQMTHNDKTYYLLFSDKGLCYIGSPNASFDQVTDWSKKKLPTASYTKNNSLAESYVKEIQRFLNGRQQRFECPVDLIGTAFQLAVWDALSKIPYGETRTYTAIAQATGRPKAVRAVATAIGANPLLMIVPCHRVIAKSGSLAGFRAGIEMKKELLSLEKSI